MNANLKGIVQKLINSHEVLNSFLLFVSKDLFIPGTLFSDSRSFALIRG
ncbi:MAG: hypothetical protein QOH67_4605 [Hyphomicrobiales bacterium]|jgi:hypothetical protein|nr:hypothetical protein [Hyphomicrobiales bacterium]